MEKMIQVLGSFSPLSEEDCMSLSKIIQKKTLQKGDFWIQAGRKNHHVAFLETGYLRKFYVHEGKEITDFFYFEHDFCADLPSIIENTGSIASFIAMQPTQLITFSYHDFNALCQKSPTLEHLYRVIVEATFLRFYKRTTSFILQTPKERYHQLMSTNQHIFQKATQYHIASYLGISHQHLSRLRGEDAP